MLAGSLQTGSLSRSSVFFPLVSRASRKLAATEANLTTRISISPWRSFLLPITILLCCGSWLTGVSTTFHRTVDSRVQPNCLPLNHRLTCLFCFETPCSQGRAWRWRLHNDLACSPGGSGDPSLVHRGEIGLGPGAGHHRRHLARHTVWVAQLHSNQGGCRTR
jgi:hypothetical protein